MTNARHNALSLAVAIAIGSFIVGTQALADRRLQTKSVDIQSNGQAEFAQSEVIVNPTLDDDQQPIPNSFTTTYPDQTEARAGYVVPSDGFTDILSGIEGGVSVVDLFETDDNDAALEYTKVLKVGNEGVFRFTHNLKKKKLLIEVREGMTHQDSIRAVRAQSDNTQTLDPFTKVASPEHLAGVLKSARERTGKLGEVDKFVALANLEVDKVDVRGRTFMRLVAADDPPPELQRLGQSIFVNDEALLAAATSAYTQVHVLGKELQLYALEDFLSYNQPVGYVIHVEDETQIYPVPADYPKLEVTEAPGEIIVFRGQKQNPTDIAFVEGLHDIWTGLSDCDDEPIVQVKKDNVRSYQYIIRSRQMALLEELALQHNTGLNKGRQYDQKLESLAYYEHLQQALTTATSDGADEFEFTIPHIIFVSSFITPTWVHMQLVKHFGFKPVLRNFLTNRDFIHDIHEHIPTITKMSGDPFDDLFDEDGSFASRVNDNFAGQLLEMENELYELSKRLQRRAQIAIGSDEEKLRTPQLRPEVDDEIMQLRQDLEQKTNLIHRLQKEIDRTNPQLERKVLDARAKARKIRNLELAIQLGMDDWDDTLPPEQQAELIRIKIHEIKQAIAAAGQFDYQAAKTAATKAIYTSFAVYLNIQNFDDDTSIDVQKKCLIQKIKAINSQEQLLSQKLKTMDLQQDILIKRVKTLSEQQAIENSYTEERKYAIAATLGIQSEDNTPEDRETLESTVHMKLFELAKLKQELQDIRTPGHPSAMPEVLKKLSVVEEILSPDRSSEKDDVYLRRQAISDDIQAYIREAGQRSEEKALKILEAIEALFNIKTNENDDKTTRVDRIRTRLNDDNLPKYMLNEMAKALWEDDSTALEERDIRPDRIRKRLTFKIENSDQRARERQADYILALEDRLNIYPHENVPAKTRGEAFTTKLASDLGLKFTKNENLSDRKHALRGKILALMREVNEIYDDESIKRIRNYEIACQLGIKCFKDNAPFDQSLIEAELQQLDDKVLNVGRPDVNDRIAAIENELDRQMARLGPKPRYVLERDVARARRDIEKTESELEEFRRKLDAVHSKAVPNSVPEQKETLVSDDARIVALRNKQLELFGDDVTADRSLQLTRQHEYLEREVEVREANIKNMKQTLAAAEQAMENEGGPFQYTPKQANILAHLHTFTQAHPLKKQALEAALGLAESAKLCGKPVPNFQTFDFDDEFAPIRLQAKIPDLTFNQATRIVKVFKDLKTTFALESPEDQSLKILDEVQNLASHARAYIKTGPQEYDDEIYGMGEAAIYFVQHEQGDLKDFSEYFAVRSVSGNKIISLLRKGLISQVELEHYLKAVRGVDGYQTVDEFEHFLGYRHGVKVPRFKSVVRMLSDEGVDEFVQSVFSPVIVTATEPAGMKESVVGMKEYAAAVIANYVLDDIAFENGRKTAAFLTNVQDTLAPYANAVGVSESGLIKAIHDTLMQAHAAAVELELNDYWIKPSAFLLQAITWYHSSYKPLLVTRTAPEAVRLSLSNMALLYLLDLTNRGDYTHRMLTPFQHWLERYGVDLDRTGQYAFHTGIEQVTELGGLAMPFGKAASSVILLKTGSMLFNRQYNANPHRYRSLFRLVPEIVKSMTSGQGVQVPLLHRITPEKVKTLASVTAGLVLGPVATAGSYAHGLLSGFTYAQTFGFALASSLTFDFFMNDNKVLTQWLGGPLGRSLDKLNRWRSVGETESDYAKRAATATPQRFNETDEEYANRVKANKVMHGWTRNENYLQFRERRDRSMKMYEHGWEKYFRDNVPKWSFSHAESIPYSYTLGAFYE